MLPRNVGGIDRVVRITFGAICFFGGLLSLSGKTTAGVTIAVVGLLAMLTGIVRFCVLYIPFGISTAQPEKPRVKQSCNCAMFMEGGMDENDEALAAEPNDARAEAMTTAAGKL